MDRATLFPQRISDWMPEETRIVESIVGFVSEMDLVALGIDKERGRIGRPSLPRKLLLAVWLYGLIKGIRTCRKLEEACRLRVDFRYLAGRVIPDHTTLWRFFDEHRAAIKELLRLFVQVLKRLDQVDTSQVIVDGTTVKAAGSRRKAMSRKRAEEKYEQLRLELERRMDEMVEGEEKDDGDGPVEDHKKLREQLRCTLEEEVKRDEISSTLSLTDPESRVLRYKEGGSGPGYNVQVTIEGKNGMVVSVEATTDVSDASQLSRQVMNASEITGEIPAVVVADTGYHSAEEFGSLDEMGVDAYCPPQRNHRNDPNNPFSKTHFIYDEGADEYICPLGKRLQYWGFRKKKKGRRQKEGECIYLCKLGEKCPAFAMCTTNKRGRRIHRALSEKSRDRVMQRLATPEGAELMVDRRAIERRIGVIKCRKGVDRIYVWGRKKTTQYLYLVAVALNLDKSIRLLIRDGDDPVKRIRQVTREVMAEFRGAGPERTPPGLGRVLSEPRQHLCEGLRRALRGLCGWIGARAPRFAFFRGRVTTCPA